MENKVKVPQITDDQTLNLVLDTLKLNKQAIIFVNSKRSAEKTAENCSKLIKDVCLNELSEKVTKVVSTPTKQCERLAKCVKKGIAFHHAGLTGKQRELVEDSFREGKIKIIAATPTLCLSEDTKIWIKTEEKEVKEIKKSDSIFVLSKNKIISIKAQKIQKNLNSQQLIQISSVSDYSIKVTPNHKMLIKRNNKKLILTANKIRKTDKIATIGYIDIKKPKINCFSDFVKDNNLPINKKLETDDYYLIGAMLGDGYSGSEFINNKIKYKGTPVIVGIDEEVFASVEKTVKKLKLSTRRSKSSNNVPQLHLGKNKWFREFLCRCGIEKREKKYINSYLMKAKIENISYLLRGLFDTDGYVEKKGNIGFSNSSKKLIKQMQKLLLRYNIVTRIRRRPAGVMKIYEKEYTTLPHWELSILNKRCILDFYKFIGFKIERKQKVLLKIVAKICSNLHYITCKRCNYKIYFDVFSGRTKQQKEWAKEKLKVIKLLGKKGELGSNEIKKILLFNPKKNESRLNHHYTFIKKRKIGNKSKTEWFWSLNKIGKWLYNNIIINKQGIKEFLKLQKCPLCNKELDFIIKKGWKHSDFEGDIYWDIIRDIKKVDIETDVYDVVLPKTPENDHLFVANGFLVHNSMGIDLPAFRTILKDLRRFGRHGLNWIPVLEYLQMAGRAGRPSYDKLGQAIAVATTEAAKEEIETRYIYGEPEDIYSKLAVEPVLRTYVLSLIATNFVNTKKQLLKFFEKTFWAHQYKDMFKLNATIEKMIELLKSWKFITSTKETSDFQSADELQKDEKLKATTMGSRVSQLYIDPLTANYIITCLKRSEKKNITAFSFLQMVCHTLEIRPLMRVKVKEFAEIQAEHIQLHDSILEEEPTQYDMEYEQFLASIKTALMLRDWTEENNEEYLLEKYAIRPGELNSKLNSADWLLYASAEITRIMKKQKLLKEINKTRYRLKYGVKEELIALLELKGVGRIRARKLYNNRLKNLGDLKKADVNTISQLIGKKLAINIKEQLGQDIDKLKVKERKRKGQISLLDF